MKKYLLLFFVVAMMAVTSAFAQTPAMQIFKDGNILQSFSINSIDSVRFAYVLNPPIAVNAQLNDKSVDVFWTAVQGATSYQVYRSGDNKIYSLLAENITRTTYTDNSPLTGTNYYKVKAMGNGEQSALSTASAPVTLDDDNGLAKGLYMGIVGFNEDLIDKGSMSLLASNTKSGFTSFVNNLTTKKGTVLYYGVDKALDKLTTTPFPSNLSSVYIVTFTDGLDQGSLPMINYNPFLSKAEYRTYLDERIKSTSVQGLPLTAYTIGIRGGDVTNIEEFHNNLVSLASSEENAMEVTSMSEVNNRFQEIAEQLTSVTQTQTVSIKFPMLDDGQKYRFTFDNVSSATQSNCYIEGTLNVRNNTLNNVRYVGLTCSSGTSIQGTRTGIKISFDFVNLKDADGNNLSLDYVNEYYLDGSYWQVNSEFDKGDDIEVTVERSSAAIMLVLDCSSSLQSDGDKFTEMKTHVKNFINTLAAAMGDVDPGHEYVDLGLPSGTLWATCNVGASSPGEYGDYFAWGETKPKSDYSWSTYKYCKGTKDTMTKYCTSSSYGTVDNKTELEPSDDAATANWGSEWQMPSEEQCDELINSSYTTTTWTTLSGGAWKITSKSNGNSIFLPAAGSRDGTIFDYVSRYGYCWSRSLGASYSDGAYVLRFDASSIYTYRYDRSYGRSVRPVRILKNKFVMSIDLNKTEIRLTPNKSTQLMATVLPWYATNKNVKWESSNKAIATVDEAGKVTALAVGTCTITCSATDGSGVKAECKVTVVTHDYVDLGLPSGTLWATCNVGANSPEEYGDYFAWGETEPKTTYNWSTYKHCKGTDDTMTKYCTDSDYGTVDNKRELEPSDDAATVNWGSGWQMPSEEQCKELNNSSYTTTTWITMNGVEGRMITSKSNGNSIFLPAAGSRDGSSLSNAGSSGRFWSRSLYTSYYNYYAYCLYFYSTNIYRDYSRRYYGRSVRPVRVMDAQTTVAVSNIELSQTEFSVMVGETSQLSASVLPWYATNKKIQWESSNADVATVDETGKVVAVAAGTCTITCSATDGSGVKAECKVTVKNVNSGTLDGHDYVDLGLPSGTLWATCNVGASKPEEYGDYFAWGETKPKTTYNWSTYLEPSDDAATVNWGSGWQMPSREQLNELINSSYTTRTWTTLNGVEGEKITSKSNGNSIFLPAAGYRSDTSLSNAGSYGHYWSRSLRTSSSNYAYYLYFGSSYVFTYYFSRYYGQSVRPVRVKN